MSTVSESPIRHVFTCYPRNRVNVLLCEKPLHSDLESTHTRPSNIDPVTRVYTIEVSPFQGRHFVPAFPRTCLAHEVFIVKKPGNWEGETSCASCGFSASLFSS